MQNDRLLDAATVAKRLNISKKTLYRRVQYGDIDVINMGTSRKPLYKFKIEAVENYIRSREVPHAIE